MKQISCWMALVLMAGAVPVHADRGKCTEPDAQTCLNHMATKRTLGWLGLDFDRSDPKQVVVEAVTPTSPAAVAGFRVGDVMLTLNGASFQDDPALQKAKGEWMPGQKVTCTIRRGPIQKTIPVTLGRYTRQGFVSMLGEHMLEYHTATMAASTEETNMEGTTQQK